MAATATKFTDYLHLPSEITDVERTHAQHVNRIALWFFTAHPPVFMLVAWLCGTGVVNAAWMTAAVLVGPWVATYTIDNPRRISMIMGVTAMCMGGLLVHFGQGPMQIEMHFYFFVLLALLAMTSNPAAILAAAVTVSLHHLAFWFFLPSSVFNYDASIWVVLVHALFVVLESVAACYVARNFFDNVIGLDAIVQARTTALDARNDDMRLVLDNVEQGLLTVDADGCVAAERSAAVDAWIGPVAEGARFAEVLGELDETLGAWFELGCETLFEETFPEELAIEQLPARFDANGRALALDYKVIRGIVAPGNEEGSVERLLVVMSDVTAELERERSEQTQRETMALFSRIVEDRTGFMSFFDEAARLVHSVVPREGAASLGFAETLRALHTLKGNCGLFGVVSIASYCHELESAMSSRGETLEPEERQQLLARWTDFSVRLGKMLGERSDNALELTHEEYDALMRAVVSEVPREHLAELLHSLRNEPCSRTLMRTREHARSLAESLGKPGLRVNVEANGLRLPPRRFTEFWSAFAHAVRNAVDHGIEAPEERAEVQKPEAGQLWLETKVEGDRFVLTLRDDGRGVDWARVRARAQAMGIPHSTEDDLVEALFTDGVSTKETTTAISGRGVGMPALRAATRSLGGEVEVSSTDGQGSTFRFVWPVVDVFGGDSSYATGEAVATVAA